VNDVFATPSLLSPSLLVLNLASESTLTANHTIGANRSTFCVVVVLVPNRRFKHHHHPRKQQKKLFSSSSSLVSSSPLETADD
jgi:hypothetical protein